MTVVFVVEGHSDANQVLNALAGNDVECIVTNGTRIDNRIRQEIEEALSAGKRVIVLSDPDESGDMLYEMLISEFPNLARIRPNPEKCKYLTGKGFRYGVEYSSFRYLRELLGNVIQESEVKR